MRNGSENSISESHFRGGVFPTPLAKLTVFFENDLESLDLSLSSRLIPVSDLSLVPL